MTNNIKILRLQMLLKKALNAKTDIEYEYWKRHFDRYLEKLYNQKINQLCQTS